MTHDLESKMQKKYSEKFLFFQTKFWYKSWEGNFIWVLKITMVGIIIHFIEDNRIEFLIKYELKIT